MYAGVNFPRENMYRKRPDRLAGRRVSLLRDCQ